MNGICRCWLERCARPDCPGSAALLVPWRRLAAHLDTFQAKEMKGKQKQKQKDPRRTHVFLTRVAFFFRKFKNPETRP